MALPIGNVYPGGTAALIRNIGGAERASDSPWGALIEFKPLPCEITSRQRLE